VSTDAAPQTVLVPSDDGAVPTHRFDPDTDPQSRRPVIVLLQEIFGVSRYIRSRASDLAALGYLVLVPEIYWRLGDVTIDESSDSVLQQAMAAAGRVDWERAVTDTAAVVRFGRELPDADGRVALFGFCFGGGLAFSTAAVEPPDALVSYYGSALPTLLDLADRVDVPSLHHFGEADDYIPLPTVELIREAVARDDRVEFHTYPGANHAFDGPMPGLHHEDASRQAWTRTVDFLDRVLPVG